jgi:hypothetical protein
MIWNFDSNMMEDWGCVEGTTCQSIARYCIFAFQSSLVTPAVRIITSKAMEQMNSRERISPAPSRGDWRNNRPATRLGRNHDWLFMNRTRFKVFRFYYVENSFLALFLMYIFIYVAYQFPNINLASLCQIFIFLYAEKFALDTVLFQEIPVVQNEPLCLDLLDNHELCEYVWASGFHRLNQATNFDETWHGCYSIEGHPNVVPLNFCIGKSYRMSHYNMAIVRK